MYAKIWHINAFDMHSITSLSPEKILLAKPEYPHGLIIELCTLIIISKTSGVQKVANFKH